MKNEREAKIARSCLNDLWAKAQKGWQVAKDVLVQQAKDAINDVFSDTSVSLEMTVERLRELREEIDLT